MWKSSKLKIVDIAERYERRHKYIESYSMFMDWKFQFEVGNSPQADV